MSTRDFLESLERNLSDTHRRIEQFMDISQPSPDLSVDLNSTSTCNSLLPERNFSIVQRGRAEQDKDFGQLPPDVNTALNNISTTDSPEDVQAEEHGLSQPQSATEIEEIDDDVAIISSRIFCEANKQSRRNHRGSVLFDEVILVDNGHSELPSWGPLGRNKRRRSAQNSKNVEINKKAKKKNLDVSSSQQSLTLPCSEPSIFTCPVCMGKLNQETSTRCGHIFCKECIHAAIKAQKKCPTCRQKVTKRSIFRIYLPYTT